MTSVSGLSARNRSEARHIITVACQLMLKHPAEIHYTQGPQRWEGIDEKLNPLFGQYPKHGDCSSTATWILWSALAHHFHHHDHVNALAWRAGYTGTIAEHGKRVVHDHNIRVGDLILYGNGWPYEHVTVALGGGVCFSHGSEAGPFKLPIDYRSDREQVRRFI